MVVNIEFIHTRLDDLLQERDILDIGFLERRLNDSARNRKDKMILQFPVFGGKMNSADIGRCDLERGMGKGVCGKKVFEFLDDIHA